MKRILALCLILFTAGIISGPVEATPIPIQQWVTVYEDADTRLQKWDSGGPSIPGPTGLTGLFPLTYGPNLLQDTSFENYVDEATSIWAHHPDFTVINDSTQCHTGNQCITITDSHLSQYTPNFGQHVSGVTTGDWCSFGGYIKTEDAGVVDAGCYRINPRIKKGCFEGTTSWTLSEYFYTPCFTTRTKIGGMAYRKPSGTGWWDDMFYKRVNPPVVEMFLMKPNYKGLLFDDDTLIRLLVTTRPQEVGGVIDPVTVSIEGTNVSKTEVINGQAIVELDGSSLALGKYKIKIAAGTHTYPDYVIEKVSATTRGDYPFLFEDDGTTILDGQPHLILGAFMTGGYSMKPSAYETKTEEFKEMGFDIYLNYWLSDTPIEPLNVMMDNRYDHNPDPATYPYHIVQNSNQHLRFVTITEPWYKVDTANYLNACKPPVGTVIDDVEREKYAKCRAAQLSPHQGFGGYYVADEDPATRIFDRNFPLQRWLTEVDNKHPTLMVQYGPYLDEMYAWRDSVDIIGFDHYPILNATPNLHEVYDKMKIAHDSTYGVKPFWAVLQFYHGPRAGHWPTADEHRAMAYMSLAAGADGILWWSWGYNALGFVKDPVLRNTYISSLKSATLELRHFDQALLADPVQFATVSDPEILMIQRPGVLFAINHAKADTTATFTVPSGMLDVVRGECLDRVQCSMVTDRVVDATTGTFTDTFPPYGVHVYVYQ